MKQIILFGWPIVGDKHVMKDKIHKKLRDILKSDNVFKIYINIENSEKISEFEKICVSEVKKVCLSLDENENVYIYEPYMQQRIEELGSTPTMFRQIYPKNNIIFLKHNIRELFNESDYIITNNKQMYFANDYKDLKKAGENNVEVIFI